MYFPTESNANYFNVSERLKFMTWFSCVNMAVQMRSNNEFPRKSCISVLKMKEKLILAF